MHAAKRSSNTRVGGTRDKREGIELYSILGYLVHSSCTYARYYDVNERYIGRVASAKLQRSDLARRKPPGRVGAYLLRHPPGSPDLGLWPKTVGHGET